MIDDDIATLRATASSLVEGDERFKWATQSLDDAEGALAQAREVSRDARASSGSAAQELAGRARALVDLAAVILSDPAKPTSEGT